MAKYDLSGTLHWKKEESFRWAYAYSLLRELNSEGQRGHCTYGQPTLREESWERGELIKVLVLQGPRL